MKKQIFSSLAIMTIMTVTGNIDASASNALITGSDAPFGTMPLSKLTSSDYEEAIEQGIKLQNQEIDAICNQRSVPTFENTIVAFDRSGEVLNRAILALSNLESAVGDTALMNTLAKVTPLISEHNTNMMMNERLFDRIKQVYDRRNADKSLTGEDKRLIEKTYKAFVHSGAQLKGEEREKFKKLSAELSDLGVRYSQNVTNGMKDPARRLWVKEQDLSGIPESIKKAYREAAAEALAEEGKQDDPTLYMISIFRPSYDPLMTYSDRRDLRKKMYTLYNSRNRDGEFSNVQILKDIANVRLEMAKLMGKKNYAEYALELTMAQTPENVMNFLGDLNAAYTEPMRKELADIEAYARQTQGEDFKLMPWDYAYWSDQLKNSKYAFNDEDLKPYFELNNTIDGVFGLATKLYGYTFKETDKVDKYHPDVRVYEVYKKDGKLLGLLYADFFYRGGKSPGAWMTEFRAESKDEKGNKILPLISIVTNFSKPVVDEPVLLTAYEVETFLHEFGHALHGLSSEAKYESLSGTNVEHDFVELFSQFNENYLTNQEYLDGFARHYKTGEKLPADLLDRFIKAAQYGAAYSTMRQLGFGYLDMAYHTITEPLRASADIEQFEAEALQPVMVFSPVQGCMISPAFTHIFSGGYASGYYGYKWSEELDADAYKAFKENGVFDQATAAKFLKMLQSGDTKDPMDLYVEFRGKKPTVDALLERDGIK